MRFHLVILLFTKRFEISLLIYSKILLLRELFYYFFMRNCLQKFIPSISAHFRKIMFLLYNVSQDLKLMFLNYMTLVTSFEYLPFNTTRQLQPK